MSKEKHNCNNVDCNHNNTKGLCCLFNPDNCKYRQLQKENAELEQFIKTQDRKLRQHSKECDKAINRVEILAKENAELQHKVDTLQGYLDHDIEYDIDKTIQEQKIKIEELKAEKGCETCTKFDEVKLTKAKELLNEFLDFESSCMERGIYISDKTRTEAKQFISEVEKC